VLPRVRVIVPWGSSPASAPIFPGATSTAISSYRIGRKAEGHSLCVSKVESVQATRPVSSNGAIGVPYDDLIAEHARLTPYGPRLGSRLVQWSRGSIRMRDRQKAPRLMQLMPRTIQTVRRAKSIQSGRETLARASRTSACCWIATRKRKPGAGGLQCGIRPRSTGTARGCRPTERPRIMCNDSPDGRPAEARPPIYKTTEVLNGRSCAAIFGP